MTNRPALMPHQQAMKDFIVTRPFCGVWLQVGGAKTRVTLEALSEIRPSGHILVIAPKAIARSSWTAEIDKWGFGVRTRSFVVDDNDRPLTRARRLELYQAVFTDPPTMYFINQDLVADLVEAMPVRRYGKQRTITWPFPTVVIDESQEFKNPSSVRFKALRKVRPAITRLIELTGTPAPQSLLDLWSQIYLLDQGAALGEKYTDFRQKYFRPTKMVNNRPVAWEPLPWAEEHIHARIKHLVLSSQSVALNLPPISYETVEVSLPEDVLHEYRTFRREQVLELATPDPNDASVVVVTADNAAILRARLLQYASGTTYTGENHDTDFVQVHEAKLAALYEAVAPIVDADDTVLVAFRYRADAQVIPAYLEARGIPTEVFDGSRHMMDRWNARQIPVMLLQPASYGRGLNLQFGSNELIWFTLPDSLEQWIQTVGRLHRLGQSRPVRVRSLVTLGTVDAHQPALLSRKRVTQDALLEAVRAELQEDLASLQTTSQST